MAGAATSGRPTSSTLSTSGSVRARRDSTSLRDRSEQETQRRHRGIDRGLPDIVLALVHLEAPHVLGGRGIRRTLEEGREGANMADIVVLGPRPHRAHRHVVEHPLAQRGHGRFGR